MKRRRKYKQGTEPRNSVHIAYLKEICQKWKEFRRPAHFIGGWIIENYLSKKRGKFDTFGFFPPLASVIEWVSDNYASTPPHFMRLSGFVSPSALRHPCRLPILILRNMPSHLGGKREHAHKKSGEAITNRHATYKQPITVILRTRNQPDLYQPPSEESVHSQWPVCQTHHCHRYGSRVYPPRSRPTSHRAYPYRHCTHRRSVSR